MLAASGRITGSGIGYVGTQCTIGQHLVDGVELCPVCSSGGLEVCCLALAVFPFPAAFFLKVIDVSELKLNHQSVCIKVFGADIW